MLILDTDTLTFVQNARSPLHGRLIEGLRELAPEPVYATVVSFQEQARGWISKANRAKTADEVLLRIQEPEELHPRLLQLLDRTI